MPLTARNPENIIGGGGLKKVEAKIRQGPTVKRAVFGDIGNRANLIQNAKTNIGKQVSRSVSSIAGLKANSKLSSKVSGDENAVARKSVKSVGDEKVKQKVKESEKVVATAKVESLTEAFSAQLLNVEDIDADDSDNPQLVSEYANDIYKYLRTLEDQSSVQEKFLSGNDEITPKMRTILIDWLVQVHKKFGLVQEVLFLCVAILDRYLQIDLELPKTRLQLVGITALFIASKYEEVYCPDINDFAYVTDKAFSKKQIILMEIQMLTKLEYCISFPLALHFLRRNSKAGNVDARQHTLAKYLMELCLPEYSMAHFRPSTIAAAALYLSLTLLEENFHWDDTLIFYSNYRECDIAPIVSKIAALVIKSTASKHQAVRSKYASGSLMKISTISELDSKKVATLASKIISA